MTMIFARRTAFRTFCRPSPRGLATAVLAALAIGVAADAAAWERKSTLTGPRGTSTAEATGNCSGGSCSRSATATGAQGRTATRNGERSCSGNSCSGSTTTTGPRGQSATRQGSVTW